MASAVEEYRYSDYADKEATNLQAHMAEWIPDVTGIDPSQFESVEDAFVEGVRLAVALRMEYQRSPENRDRTASEREEREEQEAADRQAKAEARAAKDAELEEKRAAAAEAKAAREAERAEKAAAREAAEAERKEKAAKAKSAVADEEVDEEDEDEAPTPAPRKAKVTTKAARPGPRTAGKAGKPAPF